MSLTASPISIGPRQLEYCLILLTNQLGTITIQLNDYGKIYIFIRLVDSRVQE
jgi:hypothetical protein